MPDFVLYALIGGGLFSLLAGPVGALVIWNRWAFLGDALSHAALSGVSLALLLNLSPRLGMVLVGGLVALLLVFGPRWRGLTPSTLLAIVSHGGLALGLVLFYLLDTKTFNIMNFLLGDILTLTAQDCWGIALVGVGILGILGFLWKSFLSLSLDPDFGAVLGQRVVFHRLLLTGIVTVLVAYGVSLVGVMLATSLLVLPAAAARPLARNPLVMALLACVVGCFSVLFGVGVSLYGDIPAGPAIVLAAVCFFLVSSVLKRTQTP